MRVYHFITVTPVGVSRHELPRVRYGDFMLSAESIGAAFLQIKDDLQVIEACEVWGAPLEHLNLTPGTRLNQETETNQHHHWMSVQDTYSLVHKGKESLEAWAARRLDEYIAQIAKHTGATA